MTTSYLESLLGEREKILLTTRQHWMILVRSIFLEIVLILLIIAGSVFAAIYFPDYMVIIAAIGFVIFLLPTITLTTDIFNWSNRQYVVTNHRVIQISGIFNKNVTDSSLEKVNDVKMVQSAFGRILDYGDIEILTASELGVNLFRRIERPVRFKIAMLNAKSELEGYDQVEEPRAPAGETDALGSVLAQLDSLRKQGLLTEEEYQAKKKQVLDRI